MVTTTVSTFTTVHSIRMAGCNHTIFMANGVETELRRTHKSYYCTICGSINYFPGVSDLEQLERDIVTVKDQRDTARRNYHNQQGETRAVERSLTAHKGHTTRLKTRIAAGVCPCCRRNFVNLARHMSKKHPDFT